MLIRCLLLFSETLGEMRGDERMEVAMGEGKAAGEKEKEKTRIGRL